MVIANLMCQLDWSIKHPKYLTKHYYLGMPVGGFLYETKYNKFPSPVRVGILILLRAWMEHNVG